jgi:N-acetylmuramoyl-L-alanine amidase
MAKVICIDAGHGGRDSGAVNGNRYEKDAALCIALELGLILLREGYEVIFTRAEDSYLTLSERCKISNSVEADAFISIHLNAAASKTAKGIETWRFTNCGATTKKIASAIQTKLVAETKAKNRGVKTTKDFYVLKNTKAPAVLVECGFISNDDECVNLFEVEYQRKIAKAIYMGLSSVVK